MQHSGKKGQQEADDECHDKIIQYEPGGYRQQRRQRQRSGRELQQRAGHGPQTVGKCRRDGHVWMRCRELGEMRQDVASV